MKPHLAYLLLSLGLFGCAGMTASTLDSDAVAGLSLIQSATSAAIASGALPTGNVSGIVSDVNTVSSGLETILTGAPITTAQASSVAASFKSNASTSSYIVAATPIVNALVKAVDGTLNSGGTAAQAQASGVNVLVNATAAVQAAIATTPAPTTTAIVTPSKVAVLMIQPKALLRAPYGEHDPFHVLLARSE